MSGKFITIEGTEGVGKSTNLAFIKDRMLAKGLDVVVTREPGGTPVAEELREILLANREERFDATAELLIVFAARAQHFNNVILPAIEQGSWVLCDRFTDATFAYQGYGRGLSLESIATLENLVQGNIQPDLTFFLDIDVELGLRRASARGKLDRFEQEKTYFFNNVRQGYQQRIKQFPQRFCTIDAGQTLVNVQKNIALALDKFIDSHQ